MTRTILAWGPAVLWAGALFWASSLPTDSLPAMGGADKFAHFGVYTVFGLLMAIAAARTDVSARWVILSGVLYGASDELHQYFVPGRFMELGDWIADAVGVVAGVLLFRFARSAWQRRGTVPRPHTSPW